MRGHQLKRLVDLKKAIVAIAILLFCITILGCGGSSSPVDAAREYFGSLANNDLPRAYQMLAQSNKDATSYEEFVDRPSMDNETREEIAQIEYSLVEETSTEAKVMITHPEQGDFVLLLVCEDGEWKIDFDASLDYEPPLESGTRITLEILGEYSESDIEGAIEIIEARLSSLEIYSRSVMQDDGSVILEIPKDEDVTKVIETITQSGELQFREVLETITENDPRYRETLLTVVDFDDNEDYLGLRDQEIILPYVSDQGEEFKVRLGPMRLTGDIVAMADAQTDETGGGFKISFRLTDEATPKFAALTQELINKQLGIVLDYKLESFPTVQSAIETGEGEITGDYTREEARSIAEILKAGAFPVRFGKNPAIEEF